MKAIRHCLFPLGLTALLATPGFAIEPPEDNSPPPAQQPAAGVHAEAQAIPAEAPPVAYLGINTASVPDALGDHLGLKPGEGVVIRLLDPNGPAAKAGLAEHDIITRVGDQAIGSHEDLVAEIQKLKPGEGVSIDFIHQGKAGKKDVALTKRPEGADLPAPNRLDDLPLEGMPQEQAKRIREAIERQLRAFGGDGNANRAADPMKEMKDLQQQMQDRMAEALKQAKGGGGFRIQGGATFRMIDPEGSIELNSKDGGKEATVRSKDGKVTWSGPWDTEQDKAAAPPEVRARLDKLNIDGNFMGGGLRLNLGGRALIEPEPAEKGDKDAAQPAPPAPKGGAVE